MSEETTPIPQETVSALWKFQTLVLNPITKNWEKGVCIQNVAINPICTVKSVIIKNDSTPIKVTKIIFEDGDYIYCEGKPTIIAKNLGWELFIVN